MNCIRAPYLVFALLLPITLFSEPGLSAGRRLAGTNGTDLITETCNHTQYFDVCMSTLQSHPESQGADLHGLVAISIDVSVAHAKKTVAYLKRLKFKASNAKETVMWRCLKDCLDEYDEALDDLHQSIDALRLQSYGTVNLMVAGAMTNSDTCESGFEESQGITSPLTERNVYFFKLCSNSMAIAKLLG